MPTMTMEAISAPEAFAAAGSLRAGFTATKKLGGAVERNRAKRRLRAAAAAVLPLYGREGNDYVLVARAATLTAPFAQLLEELAAALQAVHARLAKPDRNS